MPQTAERFEGHTEEGKDKERKDDAGTADEPQWEQLFRTEVDNSRAFGHWARQLVRSGAETATVLAGSLTMATMPP